MTGTCYFYPLGSHPTVLRDDEFEPEAVSAWAFMQQDATRAAASPSWKVKNFRFVQGTTSQAWQPWLSQPPYLPTSSYAPATAMHGWRSELCQCPEINAFLIAPAFRYTYLILSTTDMYSVQSWAKPTQQEVWPHLHYALQNYFSGKNSYMNFVAEHTCALAMVSTTHEAWIQHTNVTISIVGMAPI